MLDSNLLIRLAVGDSKAESALRRLGPERARVPYQAALEFAVGEPDPSAALDRLGRAFRIVAPSMDVLLLAAEIGHRLRASGVRMRAGDLWIASEALRDDDFVVTANKRDFRRMGARAWNYMREDGPPAPPT